MRYKLGKKAARGMMGFRFSDFVDKTTIPVPLVMHRVGLVPRWYGLGNEDCSNCVWAGAAHETMLHTVQGFAQSRAHFTIHDVNSDYAAVTGYDPAKPLSDTGTDMLEAASYRRKVGIVDTSGVRHTIDSYMALRVGDYDELMLAVYLTGAVGVGVHFPQSAFDQFDAHVPWSTVKGSEVLGGHYVPVYDRAPNGNLVCVTYGRDQEITREFYEDMNDETVAYISLERLNKQKVSPESFDYDRLSTMLASL